MTPSERLLLGLLVKSLDLQFLKKPTRLGLRHLRTCRLSPEYAMSDNVDGLACEEARAALALAQTVLEGNDLDTAVLERLSHAPKQRRPAARPHSAAGPPRPGRPVPHLGPV
jgi:hypothetical protein